MLLGDSSGWLEGGEREGLMLGLGSGWGFLSRCESLLLLLLLLTFAFGFAFEVDGVVGIWGKGESYVMKAISASD